MDATIRKTLYEPLVSGTLSCLVPDFTITVGTDKPLRTSALLSAQRSDFVFDTHFMSGQLPQQLQCHESKRTFTQKDCFSVQGQIDAEIAFRCSDVFPPHGSTSRSRGTSSTQLRSSRLHLIAEGTDTFTGDQMADLVGRPKESREDSTASFNAHLIFHGPKLKMLNAGSDKGGLKLGRAPVYLDGYPPRVEIEAPDEEHTIELNGNEVARCKGMLTLTLPNEQLLAENKVMVRPIQSEDGGGRSQKFSLKKSTRSSPHGLFQPVSFSSYGAEALGPQIRSKEVIPPYPLREDLIDRRVLLIGKSIVHLAEASEEGPNWSPVWLLFEKGRKHLRLQFCGTNLADCQPIAASDRKAAQMWKRKIQSRWRLIAPLSNKKLANLWKQYLEVGNK